MKLARGMEAGELNTLAGYITGLRPKARQAVLDGIAADADALARFGQELGICGNCGRDLTDEESRALGIGPVCRQNLGM